ncbi:pentapeptide repeat-containing protein [Lentzea sp. JNUCC 0626]|uniref:pentapeptide repeat-containing protein n=1 Tax=Lentzea sp. JNUCC 0626 TaxID=3367513 RepID=UPI0037497E5C
MNTPAQIAGSPAVVMPVPEAALAQPMPPLSMRAVVVVVGGVLLLTATVVVALWWGGTSGLNGDKLVTARLDALRTGLSIGLGGGGALALYLSWRRQRATEVTLAQAAIALAQKDRDHDHAEADARERRITDLYTKAVEQLGSEKAPVRLGGLYALERLAQDNPPQRQTIVNVLCAYLRMPYMLPSEQSVVDVQAALLDSNLERSQEREVRLAAQRILANHLRPGDGDAPDVKFWPDIELDFTNAVLINLDFANIAAGRAVFVNARFDGFANFSRARFAAVANFERARFDGVVWFMGTQFKGVARFVRTAFKGVIFANAGFDGYTSFHGAQFSGRVQLEDTRFEAELNFSGTNLRKVQLLGGLPEGVEIPFVLDDGDESSS